MLLKIILYSRIIISFIFLSLVTNWATAQATDYTLKDGTVCTGGSINLRTLIVDRPAYVPYVCWKEGSTYLSTDVNCVVSPTVTTTYTLEYALTVGGSTYTKNATVELLSQHVPWVNAMNDTSICENQPVTLYVNNYLGDQLYWVELAGDGQPILVTHYTFPVSSSSTYVAIAQNSCGTDSAWVYVEMISLPVVQTAKTSDVCYGDSIMLDVVRSIGTLSWYLDGILVDPHVVVTEPQTYTVIAYNDCGVSLPDTLSVKPRNWFSFSPDVLPGFIDRQYYDILFHPENAIPPIIYTINGTLPQGLTFKSYGAISGIPAISSNSFHDYPITVTIEDGQHCKVTKNFVLSPIWQTPTAFIPGSTGRNSLFLEGYMVEIYDRNGTPIYQGTGWNGDDNKGKRVPNGTYFYKATIRHGYDQATYYSGYITVLPPK